MWAFVRKADLGRCGLLVRASSPPGAQQPRVPSGLSEPAMALMLVLRTWSLTFLDCRLKTRPAITRQHRLHTQCRLSHHTEKCDWKRRIQGIYNERDFYPHQALEVRGTSPCRPHVGTKSKDFGEPALKNLPDKLYLADFSSGLHHLASLCHMRSTRMVCCTSISMDRWFNLAFLKKNSMFSFSQGFSEEVNILSSRWEMLAFKQIFLSIKMVFLTGPEVKHLKWLNTTNSKWGL